MTRDDVHIRPAVLTDLEVLESFQQKLVHHERPFDSGIPQEGIVEYYDVKTLILADDVLFLVAEVDGRIVGCGNGQIRKNLKWAVNEYIGYVGLMYVEERYRRQGIARRIVESIVDWFHERDIQHITLQVYKDNTSAVDAYRCFGFRDFVLQMRYNPE